jgi:hypothetical protein
VSGSFDRIAIAARIRGLLSGQDDGDPAACAARLRVDEVGLRMSIDELAPNPTVEVIAAIVAAYAVDPCWLLTGEYDTATHRGILEEHESVEQVVSRLMLPVARQSGNTLRLIP